MKKLVCRIVAFTLIAVGLLTSFAVAQGWSYDFEDGKYKKVLYTYDEIPGENKDIYDESYTMSLCSNSLAFVIKDTLVYHI